MTEQRPEDQLGAGEDDVKLPGITLPPAERLNARVRARLRGPNGCRSRRVTCHRRRNRNPIVGSAAAAIVEFSGTPLEAAMKCRTPLSGLIPSWRSFCCFRASCRG